MHVKKYTAVNMQEALKLVKKELGAHAVIISTKNIEPIPGNGKCHTIEVTAAMDYNCDDNSLNLAKKAKNNLSDISEIIYPLQKEIAELKQMIKSNFQDHRGSNNNRSDDFLEKEAVELKSIVHGLLSDDRTLKNNGFHESLIGFHRQAVSRGINERLAFGLTEKVNRQIIQEIAISEDSIKSRFFMEMMRLIKSSGPIKIGFGKPKVAVFVGPTGVGKTTTVAKLAAEFSLNQKKEVALITLDTYRIAAVEQLKIYSKIIDIPVVVARDKQEFLETLDLFRDKDLVLVDTAGRSRKDHCQMNELKGYFDQDISAEIYLVLSAIEREEILFANIKRFYPLSIDRLIFTKIDEANSFGMLFNIAIKTNKPLSYFTTGQKVPEDIEIATAEKTIDLIFH